MCPHQCVEQKHGQVFCKSNSCGEESFKYTWQKPQHSGARSLERTQMCIHWNTIQQITQYHGTGAF